MELAEVAAAYPEIDGVLFQKDDYAAAYAMLRRLRDLFGKPRISEEDSIRLESIRQAGLVQEIAADGASAEEFLRKNEALIEFDFRLPAEDPRILELVNKTNQFNLNGMRYSEAGWQAPLAAPGAVLASVVYRDKFGPLGKIAVIRGHRVGSSLRLDTWVMSCRAFSRRIEHQCLKFLLNRLDLKEIFFQFTPTPKNGPLQDFFAAFLGTRPSAPFTLGRAQFDAACPPLYHRVKESQAAEPALNPWTTSQSA
jgi:FkbH-like protein